MPITVCIHVLFKLYINGVRITSPRRRQNHIMKFSVPVILFAISFHLHQVLAAPTRVLPPDEDSFYAPPDGYENAELGTVLRARIPPAQLRSIYFPINVKNAWQILVRSEDSFGNATAVVGTIIEPYNADPTKLVSYQAMEDAASSQCAPSYVILKGAPVIDNIVVELEMILVESLLSKGYYVVIPDYEGPRSAFTAGRNSGHGTLDVLRATYAFANETGLSPDAETILWGYSGGSIATGWATGLQPQYAPELSDKIIGAAVGGFATNISLTAEAVDGHLFAGLVSNAINGLSHEYYQMDGIIDKYLNATAKAKYLYGNTHCLISSCLYFAETHIFSGSNPMVPAGWAVFRDPEVKAIIDRETLALDNGTHTPQVPFFIYQGQIDHIVPIPGAERVYENWCSNGVKSLEYNVDLTGGHLSEVVAGSPAALTWITERFEGKPPVDGCVKTKRLTNLMYPGLKNGTAHLLQSAITGFFGKDIGPNGENINLDHLKAKRDLMML